METRIMLTLLALAVGIHASAKMTVTEGIGSAVTSVDRSALFNPLVVNETPLSDYSEGGLVIAVDGDSWVGDGVKDFDPFHGANGTDRAFYFPYGGSPGWVDIQTSDSKKIFAVELMYGNGWTTGDVYGQYPWGNNNATLEWQEWRGGLKISSGTLGASTILQMGTVLGFSDPVGFDQLRLRCLISTSADPNLQALALDNLNVQITPVPEVPGQLAASLLLLLLALVSACCRRSRSALRCSSPT